MKRILLVFTTCILLIMILLPTSTRGDYVENIYLPAEVDEGETFTVTFDASYFVSGEVYAKIALMDTNNNQLQNADGYGIGVHLAETKFLISETPLERNVNCVIRDQQAGKYTLAVAIYDASTDEQLYGTTSYSLTFTLNEKSDSDSSSSCSSIYGVIMILSMGLIVTRKRF